MMFQKAHQFLLSMVAAPPGGGQNGPRGFNMKRWGEPVDVGRVVGSLAKGDFMYSTGQVIMVDGGLTIPRL